LLPAENGTAVVVVVGAAVVVGASVVVGGTVVAAHFAVTHASHGSPSGTKLWQQAAQTLQVLAGSHSFPADVGAAVVVAGAAVVVVGGTVVAAHFAVTHPSHEAPSGIKLLQQAVQTLQVLAGSHSFPADVGAAVVVAGAAVVVVAVQCAVTHPSHGAPSVM
jgi:hypothetical protein